MELVRKIKDKKYNGNNVYIEEIKQYHYKTEEEKMLHKKK